MGHARGRPRRRPRHRRDEFSAHIRGHDLVTGKELWRVEDGTRVKVPTPVISDGMAVVTGGYAPGIRPTFAIPLESTGAVPPGELAWRISSGSPYTTTPLVYQGLLYMLTDSGILSAYDAATGTRLYQQRLGSGKSGFSGPR